MSPAVKLVHGRNNQWTQRWINANTFVCRVETTKKEEKWNGPWTPAGHVHTCASWIPGVEEEKTEKIFEKALLGYFQNLNKYYIQTKKLHEYKMGKIQKYPHVDIVERQIKGQKS